ncbi:MAG: hypothetical protein KIH64_006285 [Mycobacterium sp.]|nr:hypothetical protein [Mycobacterium sp.]
MTNNRPKSTRGGKRPGAGRKKGVPNKLTSELKEMILQALDGAGGVEYLQGVARSHPGPFLALVGKVLPLQVTGEGGGPVQSVTRIEVVGVAPK